jgi:hypothetical protein
MERFTSDLYAKMQAHLQDISQTDNELLYIAEQSYHAVVGYLKDLKGFIKDYEFKDQEEEVRFFKEVKPRFLKEVVYFMKIFDVESAKPVAGKEVLKTYYLGWVEQFSNYFEQNRFFYLYYRTEKSHLDELMFIKEPKEIPLMPSYSLDADPGFSNAYSFKLAKIKAYEELTSFLQTHIYGLDNKDGKIDGKITRGLSFKHSNAQFIELTYGLWKSGAFGQVTIKEAFDGMQYYFNKRITNYYGYFESMRIRKKNRTPYIDLLKDYVIRHMDEADDYPRYR